MDQPYHSYQHGNSQDTVKELIHGRPQDVNPNVSISIEKDSDVKTPSRTQRGGGGHHPHPHSRPQRPQRRSDGFKTTMVYILVFVNFILCAKLFSVLSRPSSLQDGSAVSFSGTRIAASEPEHEGGDASTPEFWLKMGLIVFLVLIGGVFAGLTIGLMGLDETNLQVLMVSGTPTEQAHAETVFNLLSRGKHWVLVTLLLGNVIVNETLPVVLDSELGGGVVAILISTFLIVVFGEIIPQAVCARYGLGIGAFCAKPMLILMYFMSPIAYPIAMLLDSWLGVHHGTTYRRTELKTLVSLHQVDGIGELTDDEVTIIASVLDLKDKPVSKVMTPLEDVFTLSEDAILDEKLMEEIVNAGYSRIPIYRHDDPSNFIGMLLVKRLITYDPEDHIPVRQFTINSLPEAAPNTSCLDILNFFQEGRSHMAIVTSEPGGFGVPVGVITLEDVIEELLGEEIVDESDVYVDVHNKIRVIRKPSKNANMLRNLKSILQSPAVSEATPLLGGASSSGPTNVRSMSMPIDNKYIATGKTILHSNKQATAAELLDPSTARKIAHTQADTSAAEGEGSVPQSGSLGKARTPSKDSATTAASPSGELNGHSQHQHKDGHVSFKENTETFQEQTFGVTNKGESGDHPSTPTAVHVDSSLSVSGHPSHEHHEQQHQPEAQVTTVTIDVPEPDGTYSINAPKEQLAAMPAAMPEDLKVLIEKQIVKSLIESPTSEAPPVQAPAVEASSASASAGASAGAGSSALPESESTQTLTGGDGATADDSNLGSPGAPVSGGSKKKKKKKKSTK